MRPLHRPRRGVINDALADARTESFMAIDTVHTLNQGRINAPPTGLNNAVSGG